MKVYVVLSSYYDNPLDKADHTYVAGVYSDLSGAGARVAQFSSQPGWAVWIERVSLDDRATARSDEK